MKEQGTPGGFALGHASGDGNGWITGACGRTAATSSTRTTRSSSTRRRPRRRSNIAKALYEEMIPGTASWNDAFNNKAFLAGEIHWTNNGISIYVAANNDPNLKKIAEDMDHAYMPIGPVGKPTELHLMYPAAGDDLHQVSAGLQGADGVHDGSRSIQPVARGGAGLSDALPQRLRYQSGLDRRSRSARCFATSPSAR